MLDDGRVGRPFAHLDEHVVEAPFDGESDQPGRQGYSKISAAMTPINIFFNILSLNEAAKSAGRG